MALPFAKRPERYFLDLLNLKHKKISLELSLLPSSKENIVKSFSLTHNYQGSHRNHLCISVLTGVYLMKATIA